MVQANKRYFARKTNEGWVVAAERPANGNLVPAMIVAQEPKHYIGIPQFVFMMPVPPTLPVGSEAWVKFYHKTINCACGQNHETNELQKDSEGRLGIIEFEPIEEKKKLTMEDLLAMPLYEALANLQRMKDEAGPRFASGRESAAIGAELFGGIKGFPRIQFPFPTPGQDAGDAAKMFAETLQRLKRNSAPVQNTEHIEKMKKILADQHKIPVENIQFAGAHGNEMVFTVKRGGHPLEQMKAANPKLHKLIQKTLQKLVELHAGDVTAARVANALEKSYTRGNKKKA